LARMEPLGGKVLGVYGEHRNEEGGRIVVCVSCRRAVEHRTSEATEGGQP
jgi:hypothetical protein